MSEVIIKASFLNKAASGLLHIKQGVKKKGIIYIQEGASSFSEIMNHLRFQASQASVVYFYLV